jgi:hypothetical protein
LETKQITFSCEFKHQVALFLFENNLNCILTTKKEFPLYYLVPFIKIFPTNIGFHPSPIFS